MAATTFNNELNGHLFTSEQYYEPNNIQFYTQLYPVHQQQPIETSEEGYWNSSPCSSDSQHNGHDCSPNRYQMTQQDPRIPFNHQTTTATSSSTTTTTYYPVPNDPTHETYEEIYYPPPTASCMNPQPFVRVVKRRTTANKKERRRTQSINSAFAYLRDCIPNVPSDTKLSKIKTLRLATSYINYLNGVLEGDQDPSNGFRAELVPSSRKINAERRARMEAAQSVLNSTITKMEDETKKPKGRTGWPQHVWASELKQE